VSYTHDVETDANNIIRELSSWDADPSEAVSEAADSEVIYTSRCHEILRASRNSNAAFEEMGPDALEGCDSEWSTVSRLAYFAYHQDLSGAIYDLSDEDRLAIREEGICECCGEVFPESDLDDEREGCEGQTLCETCYEDGEEE